MGPYAHDADLCLKEFSRSLMGRGYTWYVKLKPGVVCDWVHFYAEAKFSLIELDCTRQYSNQDLDVYMR